MLEVINPATEECIAKISVDTEESIRHKYEKARAASKVWREKPFSDRHSILVRFAHLVSENEVKLADILTKEVGKPLTQSHNEIRGMLRRLQFFLDYTEKTLASYTFSPVIDNVEETLSYEPLGVIANISAWNYPYLVTGNVAFPALLTGNTVLFKPSELAVLSGLELARLLQAAGVPADVFQVVVGGAETGSALLSLPVEGVFFTGSYATGAKIAHGVRDKMIRVQLELGGKDPVYACEDVNIEKTAEDLAEGAFYNAGQSCCAVERIYVHEKIAGPFVEHFVKAVAAYRVGNPMDREVFIGPIARKQQLKVLEEQVRDAVEKGAKLLLGGQVLSGPGYYFAPTVLAQVNHSMSVMREESFGPIIGIQTVRDDEEAVRLMNDTQYGLTAGVYTLDRERGRSLLKRVRSGTAYVNCCDRVSPRLPWSGRGYSGIGTVLSFDGIRAFVEPRGWHVR